MAARTPPKTQATRTLASEQGRNFLRAMRALGPQPALADAIEAVYAEEHSKGTYGHEGE